MSELRVNTIVAAEGTSAPNLPYGIQVPTGMGITVAGGDSITGVVTAASFDGTSGIVTSSGDLYAGDSVGVLNNLNVGSATTIGGITKITANTSSTSTGTGALVVTGGAGIGGDVWIGAGLSVAGTLTYEDVTSVDSVGMITAKNGVNISGGELRVGTALTIGIAGVCTGFAGFSIDNDTNKITLGSNESMQVFHNATNSIIKDTRDSGTVRIQADNFDIRDKDDAKTMASAEVDGSVNLRYSGTEKFRTTHEGIKVTGFTSTTAGLAVTGGMWEGAFIKAGKLSDNKTLGISTSNIFVFTTQETTTCTPNIIWNDSYALSSKMKVGDTVTVTVITTAATAGYLSLIHI